MSFSRQQRPSHSSTFPKDPAEDISMSCLEPPHAIDITAVLGNFSLDTQYGAAIFTVQLLDKENDII